jgi:hypothetical protein
VNRLERELRRVAVRQARVDDVQMFRLMTTLLAVGLLLGAGACGSTSKNAPRSTAAGSVAAATPKPAPPKPPPARKQIRATAKKWAPLFAAGDKRACDYMTRSGQQACDMNIYFDGKPSAFQRSFGGASIQRIKVKGDQAAVLFSNHKAVVLAKGDAGDDVPNSDWGIVDLGGHAGENFFK